MKKIIVDAMGGDLGSGAVVEGILLFLSTHDSIEITVVGKKEELTALEGKCKIIDARSVVPMTAGALDVMRLKDSSMMVALQAMKDENYDAVVSCGSTGGFLSAATLLLKTIPGIKRAALMSPFPTHIKGKKAVILDIGANVENSPEELLQFAKMGRLYSQIVFNVQSPSVYLLNNGTEEHKGNALYRETYKLLKESEFPNFQGNIEARNALDGSADVVVADGFTGNIFLKSSEGIAKFMGQLIKDAFKKNLWTKIGYLHVRKGMKNLIETMDYKSTGGAMLLGVNGIVVKAHGSSDGYSFSSALEVANKLIEGDLVNRIKAGILDA